MLCNIFKRAFFMKDKQDGLDKNVNISKGGQPIAWQIDHN